MHKSFILIILAANTLLSSVAQTTGTATDKRTGNWIGAIQGGPVSLYFRIKGDSLTGFTADWNSPSQKALGLPCKTVLIKGDSLLIGTGAIVASYRGHYLPGRDSITGVWQQNGRSFIMNLRRMARPQTPHPPFPYRTDSIEYDNAGKTVHLGATLSLPFSKTEKKYPVVILITGSGQQDRDETLFEHKPFAVIADYLTRRGMAVLRVDDRGTGKSKGDLKDATTSDFADDVLTSIGYLKTRKEIDTTRIGLIGHSEGGMIAPIVYSRWPHLNLIILLAGPGLPGRGIILRQQTDPVKQQLGQAVYDAYYPLVAEKLRIMEDNYGQPDSVILRQLKAGYTRWKAGLPDSIAAPLNVKNVSEAMYAYQEAQELKPWLKYFYHTDPAVFLRQVKCPVLALDGSKDTQVDPEQNIPAIKAALTNGGNTYIMTRVFPGLNHLFQHAATGDFNEYAVIEESFAPEVLAFMGEWIGKIDKL
ncbi:MAG TPA: alpha/beta hydrolase [Puia sp.]|jgi:hypothetical protein